MSTTCRIWSTSPASQGLGVRATLTADEEEVLGVNDRAQLAEANAMLRRRTLDDLLRSGVTIVDPATTYIEPEVTIEPDTIIQPGCHLRGRTRIARDCEIGPNTYVVDSADRRRLAGVVLGRSRARRVGQRVSIGPFSHLRPGAVIEDDVELGNYAEVKASRIGAGTQMHHFSYVGDADIGAAGQHRRGHDHGQLQLGDAASRAARSSRTTPRSAATRMLVAPVQVGAGAMTGGRGGRHARRPARRGLDRRAGATPSPPPRLPARCRPAR